MHINKTIAMTWLCSTIIVHYVHIFWFTWLALVLVLCMGSYLTLRVPLDCSCISIHFFYLHLSPLAHYLTHIFKLMWSGSLFFWQCLTSLEDCSFHVHILVGLSHLFPCAPHAIVLPSRATFPYFVDFCSFIISNVRVHLLPLTLDGPTTIIQFFCFGFFSSFVNNFSMDITFLSIILTAYGVIFDDLPIVSPTFLLVACFIANPASSHLGPCK